MNSRESIGKVLINALLNSYLGDRAKYGASETSKNVSDATLKRIKSCYYSLVTEMDYHVGRLIDCLQEQGLYNDTLIIFTCDHGEMLGE